MLNPRPAQPKPEIVKHAFLVLRQLIHADCSKFCRLVLAGIVQVPQHQVAATPLPVKPKVLSFAKIEVAKPSRKLSLHPRNLPVPQRRIVFSEERNLRNLRILNPVVRIERMQVHDKEPSQNVRLATACCPAIEREVVRERSINELALPWRRLYQLRPRLLRRNLQIQAPRLP